MRVGIITTFYEHSSGYSLIRTVETQIDMLLRLGIMPMVLVRQDFQTDANTTIWSEEYIDIRRCMPALTVTTEIGYDFDESTIQILEVFRNQLADMDVVITHDLVFQEYYTAHCVAIHRYAETRDDVTWLHYIHSVPIDFYTSNMTYPVEYRYMPPPGYVVYPNYTNISHVCRRYSIPDGSDKIMVDRSSHSIDPLSLRNYSPITRDLVRKSDLMSGDVVVIFPTRLNASKQVDKAIRLLSGVNKLGYDVRMLILDWQSTGKHFNDYRSQLLQLIDSCDLSDSIFFASKLNAACVAGTSPVTVIELLDFANVGIFPSMVETYSLTVHEALCAGVAVILNDDLEIMHELFGDVGMYMRFGSYWKGMSYDTSMQAYYDGEAHRMVTYLKEECKASWNKCQAIKDWNPNVLSADFDRLLHLSPRGME